MRIAYGSDIHDEFGDQKAVPLLETVDVLILAGDIAKAKKIADYAAQYLNQAQHIICVLGNHERWGEELTRSVEKAKERITSDRIHILEKETIEILDWKIIGATAWTDFKYGPHGQSLHMFNASKVMNDYKKIKKFTGSIYRRLKPEDTLADNMKAHDFIFREITPKSIVVTHHAPTHLSIGPEHQDDDNNAAYVSNWGNEIAYSDGPALWFHGHIHSPSDYMVGDTRILCNPIGYPGQIPGSGFKYVDV